MSKTLLVFPDESTREVGIYDPCCFVCEAWKQLRDDARLGACRRHAPRPAIDGGVLEGSVEGVTWPVTHHSQWCAEFLVSVAGMVRMARPADIEAAKASADADR